MKKEIEILGKVKLPQPTVVHIHTDKINNVLGNGSTVNQMPQKMSAAERQEKVVMAMTTLFLHIVFVSLGFLLEPHNSYAALLMCSIALLLYIPLCSLAARLSAEFRKDRRKGMLRDFIDDIKAVVIWMKGLLTK